MKSHSLYPERVLAEFLKHNELKMPKTEHKIILGDSRHLDEIENESVHLIVTSPPYPMIEIWDNLFTNLGCKTL